MKNLLKKMTIAISLFVVLCNSVSGQKVSKFVINGVLTNFKTMPDKIFLLYPKYENKNPDSSNVVNGTYKFTGEIEQDAVSLQIALGPEPDRMSPTYDLAPTVIVTAGETKIVSDKMLYNYTETGAAEHLSNQFNMLFRKYADIAIAYNHQRKTIDYLTRLAVRSNAYKKYLEDVRNYPVDMYNYIVQHPNSALVPQLAFDLSNSISVKQEADAVIDILSTTAVKSKVRAAALAILQDKSKELAAKATVSAGKLGPDFTQNDVNGHPLKLSSFRGKFVLVDFWASWCGPCRAENPNVIKAYTKYHDKNFEILGVSLDDEKAKSAWVGAIQKDGLTWPQVSDLKGWKNEAAKLYAVTAIPQNFLVDPDGKIIATNLRGDALDKALEKFLK